MKKILLGLVAAAAFISFAAPARAEGDADKAPAGDKAEKKPAKKGKKAKKAEGEEAPAGDKK
jgi:hypothetical protein